MSSFSSKTCGGHGALAGIVIVLAVCLAGCGGRSASRTPTAIDFITQTPMPPTATLTPTPSATATPTPSPTATPTVVRDGGGSNSGGGAAPTATETPDPSPLVACGDILAPLDKNHRLSPDCVPGGIVALPESMTYGGAQYLTSTTLAAMQTLFDAAAKAGYVLTVNSGYRSYDDQVYTYNYWVQTQGRDYADRTSARPGHSEHQLGTTADVGTDGHVLEDFSGTPAAAWLAANSWTYGFIVSYPPGKESVTGYAPEPWHIRYVGVGVAASVHASGLTLHEYLLR